MFDGDLRQRIEALEGAMDRVAPHVVSEPFSSRVLERWPVVNSLDELRLVIIEHGKALEALESKPDPHYVALEPPGCGPEGVHIGAEIVALRERIDALQKQIPAFLPACIADHEQRVMSLETLQKVTHEKVVAAIVEGCRAGNEQVENLIAELSRKLLLVEKAVIDQNDAAVHHLGEWHEKIEQRYRDSIGNTTQALNTLIDSRIAPIENGTAPGVQTTLADLSDRIQDLVQTAAQVSKYLHLLAALNGKKLGMSPYEPERQPVPILIDLKSAESKMEKHKAR